MSTWFVCEFLKCLLRNRGWWRLFFCQEFFCQGLCQGLAQQSLRPIPNAAALADPWRIASCLLIIFGTEASFSCILVPTSSSYSINSCLWDTSLHNFRYRRLKSENLRPWLLLDFSFSWISFQKSCFWGTRMLSNQASVPNLWSSGLQIDEYTPFCPSPVDDSFPKLTLCTYSFSADMFPAL